MAQKESMTALEQGIASCDEEIEIVAVAVGSKHKDFRPVLKRS